MRIHLGVVLLLVAMMRAPCCQPPRGIAEAATPAAAAALVGAWNGEWTAPTGDARGAVEVVLSRVPGGDGIVGQFTFLTGGLSRTLRYEGRIDDGVARFPLVGDGHLVLHAEAPVRPGAATALHGEWDDARGAFPAPRGRVRLSRSPVR